MSFNPDPNKQAQEVIFSGKIQKSSQPSLIFNNNVVTQSLTQKHLGMFSDTKLDFRNISRVYSLKLKRQLVKAITEAPPHIAEIAFTYNL